jgi:hypothetical protein
MLAILPLPCQGIARQRAALGGVSYSGAGDGRVALPGCGPSHARVSALRVVSLRRYGSPERGRARYGGSAGEPPGRATVGCW